MATGVKLLIVGQEASGKTSLISNIEKSLVMSTDNKAFKGKVPHFRVSSFNGSADLFETILNKFESYKDRFKSYPETLVIDSITHLANNMERWANEKFTGFNVYLALGKETLEINAFIEEELVPNGINVVLTAHTVYDADMNKFKIPASGSFGRNGSWLSVTDEARYIELKGSSRILHYKSMKFPGRSLIEEYPESIKLEEYDINKDIETLLKNNSEADSWSLD